MSDKTVGEIAAACGGTVCNCFENKTVTKIVNNDKKCGDNCCYVSIDGDRYSGNDFAEGAIKNGASVILSESLPSEDTPCILVSDVKKALLDIAEYYREKELEKVVAITGSVGKTTVKELCASVLMQREGVLKTDGNQNNLIGLPLTVLSNDGCGMAVLELGISEKGEMEELSRVAKPDIAVITCIGNMHAETLGDRGEIAEEKLKILTYAKKNCILIVPEDEALLKMNTQKNVFTVGVESETADYSVQNIRFCENGSFFDLRTKEDRVKKDFFVPIIGTHGCHDAAFAYAVADLNGLNENEIRNGLARYKTVGDRQNITEINGVTVMCDCYNFGPESASASLEAFTLLCRMKKKKYSVAMLGSMLELGKIGESEHIKIGRMIARSGISQLITLGDIAQNIALGALMGGMNAESVHSFKDGEREQAGESLQKLCAHGTALLLKGSRKMKMEEFLEYIK